MATMTVPQLVLRQAKGSPLTLAEGDANFSRLRDFANSLAALFGVALNPDGSLKTDVVLESVIKDRQISARKLQLTCLPMAEDTGAANALTISLTPALTGGYANNLIFWVRVKNTNTGPSTLAVDGLAAKPILKLGTEELAAGDIKAKSVICVAFYGDAFHLVLGQGATAPATGGGGDTTVKFEPPLQPLPGAGLDFSWAHELGVVPDVKAYLVCIAETGDLGYARNDEVELARLKNSTGGEAFSLTFNDASIVITQHVSPPRVARLDAPVGEMADITLDPESWRIKIVATKVVANASYLTPAVDIQVAQPDGALCYGKDLFFFGRHNNGKVSLNVLDLTTNKITRTDFAGDTRKQMNMIAYRTSSNEDRMAFTCTTGAFYMPLQDPVSVGWQPTEFGTGSLGDVSAYKPCWFDESGGVNSPILYAVGSGSNNDSARVGVLRCRKFTTATNVAANHGSDLNLLDSTYANAAQFTAWHATAGSKVILFQYNPRKKRIYVITAETGFVHVFNISGSDGNFATWWAADDTTRYGQLEYEGAIAIGGGSGYWGLPQQDRYAIEIDLGTGEEKSIVLTRTIAAAYLGTVTRIPWVGTFA